MLPVAIAITDELERHDKQFHERSKEIRQPTAAVIEILDLTKADIPSEHLTKEIIADASHIENSNGVIPVVHRKLPFFRTRKRLASLDHEKKYAQLKKGFLLSVAYSSTIGGLSSLVGTAPNVLVKGFADDRYSGTDFKITFQNFLSFALPAAVIMLVFCWMWLQLLFNTKELFQWRITNELREAQNDLHNMLRQQYKDLGTPSWSECSVAVIFVMLVLLWVTKDFDSTPGWDIIFRSKYISDGTVALFIGVLPMILPNKNPFKKDWHYQPIIKWTDLAKNMPWGALILLGAGLAIAEAFQVSKLSESMAEVLSFISAAPMAAVILAVIIISGLFTEVTSNLSTATPPNAIVFASGELRVWDMMKAGIVMNIIGFLVVFFAATTWMPKVYNLNDESIALFFSINVTNVKGLNKLSPHK
ncbi:unnamed protein product [Didymodactylos carnosus]|uniref:Uncharacterized protein n=1 Tax=Didymodactylos carnosus TaxID=1234261 RepID=A0A814G928_9BILA|nr:unnamed protein product [Didymodactylos carnosus]CAF1038628.1 unnamed protein product [Didymodactylos carnosus]CAF3763673.1 unnamed protein product [Didymodactylos carnosus]CAF3806806.1 unnamed protein product [Didymodactylos carnosus]